jgi:hypothetical protein
MSSYISSTGVDVSGRQPRPARLTAGERKFLEMMGNKRCDRNHPHDQYLLGQLDALALCTYQDTDDAALLNAAVAKQGGES